MNTDDAVAAGRIGRSVGRPTKLNLARLRRVVEAVTAGLPLRSAAALVGVGEQTLLDWRRRGLEERVRVSDAGVEVDGLIDAAASSWPSLADWEQAPESFDRREWPYFVFSVALAKARAEWESTLVDTVRAASSSQWQAAAWMLERRDPENYGRGEGRLRVAIESAVEAAMARRPPEPDPVSVDDMERRFQQFTKNQARRRSAGQVPQAE